MAMRLEFNSQNWENVLGQLGKRGPIAIARGLNRTAATERTAMSRSVSKDMGIPVGVARTAIAVKRATGKNTVAQVVARGKRLPLIDFKARGPEPSRGRGRGVSYVMKGERKRIASAFITTTRRQRDGSGGDHRGVFIRALGAGRLPIKELKGVSIAVSFARQLPAGEARRAEVLEKNVVHEIEFELSRLTSST